MEIFDIKGFRLCVNETHRFGTDALKLAEFVVGSGVPDAPYKIRNGQVICDLCTGCGIIPFALLANGAEPAKIYALDIDESAINLLKESVKINKIKTVIPINEDLKNITQIPAESVDLITVNPPYYKADGGFKRERDCTARHEILCNLDDVVSAAARLLKFGGRLKMCHIPERLADVICTLRKYNLEPKVIKLLTNNKKEPWLMLTDAKKGGKAGMKIYAEN